MLAVCYVVAFWVSIMIYKSCFVLHGLCATRLKEVVLCFVRSLCFPFDRSHAVFCMVFGLPV